MQLTDMENKVRVFVYRFFVEEGRAPTIDEVATKLAISPAQASAAFEGLAEKHVLVLEPGSDKIRMAMPFSAAPTPYRVTAGSSSWWANCAWDALGIPAMLNQDATLHSRCPISGQPLTLSVVAGQLEQGASGRVHFAVPAARWWDDIGYT